MKRDMNLIRAIVLAIRDHDGRPSASEVQSLVSNEDNAVFGYHIQLLLQGAMMTGVDTGVRKDRHGVATLALTWAGQDFADDIANDAVWTSIHQSLADAELQSASFTVWSQLVVAKMIQSCGGA